MDVTLWSVSSWNFQPWKKCMWTLDQGSHCDVGKKPSQWSKNSYYDTVAVLCVNAIPKQDGADSKICFIEFEGHK